MVHGTWNLQMAMAILDNLAKDEIEATNIYKTLNMLIEFT